MAQQGRKLRQCKRTVSRRRSISWCDERQIKGRGSKYQLIGLIKEAISSGPEFSVGDMYSLLLNGHHSQRLGRQLWIPIKMSVTAPRPKSKHMVIRKAISPWQIEAASRYLHRRTASKPWKENRMFQCYN